MMRMMFNLFMRFVVFNSFYDEIAFYWVQRTAQFVDHRLVIVVLCLIRHFECSFFFLNSA